MNERARNERTVDPEKRAGSKLLVRSIGGAALILGGYRAGKKLAKRSVPAALRILDRLDIVEHEGHPQSAAVFKSLAESFGVTVNDDHIANWRSMLTVARALDTIVDDTQPDSTENEVGALLSGKPIPGVSQAEAADFYAIVSNASDERQNIITEGLTRLNDFAKELRTTSDTSEMLRLRREESELFARMMTIDNPEHDPSIETFNEWFVRFGQAGYLLDSLSDLVDDYKKGVIAVKPTPASYFYIGKEAVRDNCHSLSQLPKRTVANLAVAGIKKAARKALASRTRQQN